MIFRGATILRIVLILGFGALIAMSTFGIVYSGMSMGMDGRNMSDCPLMPGSNMCHMSPLEHASLMQSIFTNILQQEDATLLLILVVGLVATSVITWFRNLLVPDPLRHSGSQYRYRERLIPQAIQELFSNGILNPKPF
jgi:protein-tyrosine-phosphatase